METLFLAKGLLYYKGGEIILEILYMHYPGAPLPSSEPPSVLGRPEIPIPTRFLEAIYAQARPLIYPLEGHELRVGSHLLIRVPIYWRHLSTPLLSLIIRAYP